MNRLPVLDGWRGVSILCVLAGHMLPLGPKALDLNETVAAAGMSLFFILSGFLIVSMLVTNNNVFSFLIRRFCRIVPLAWAFLIVVLLFDDAGSRAWTANLLFYANLPPFYLNFQNGHFWSLGIEVQFYAAIAIVVGLSGRRGLWLLPVICIAVTVARVTHGVPISIVTWWRIDEILAGGCLALLFRTYLFKRFAAYIPWVTPLLIFPLLLAGCHPAFSTLNYARPYLAAALIGSTCCAREIALQQLLRGRVLGYLAEVSYAVYVIHPIMYSGWLGEGDPVVRYTKRIASFVLTFAFAHCSTRYYEKYWISLGHRLAARIQARSARDCHAPVQSTSGCASL